MFEDEPPGAVTIAINPTALSASKLKALAMANPASGKKRNCPNMAMIMPVGLTNVDLNSFKEMAIPHPNMSKNKRIIFATEVRSNARDCVHAGATVVSFAIILESGLLVCVCVWRNELDWL